MNCSLAAGHQLCDRRVQYGSGFNRAIFCSFCTQGGDDGYTSIRAPSGPPATLVLRKIQPTTQRDGHTPG